MEARKGGADIDVLTCIGRDDNDMESIFNLGSFIQKIDISSAKDANGLYQKEDVKEKLIEKIKNV